MPFLINAQTNHFYVHFAQFGRDRPPFIHPEITSAPAEGDLPLSDTRRPALDDIDRQLISALQTNAREPVAMLARQLGIARTTVTSRLARLEKAKIITGYGVRLSQRMVDGGLQAYVGITVQPRSGKEVLRRLGLLPQVQQLCAVSGEFDYVAWLRTDSPEQLDQLLDLIGSVDGVEKTTTSIILSSKIDRGQPV
jgi:DNA-binding Lrp family transcriptional regulator